MVESLNEEQTKTAQKEGRTGFDFTVFVVTLKTDDLRTAYIESERFIDARNYACRHFGVPEVVIMKYAGDDKPVPRWQVRMHGHASNGNTIRMQVRKITSNAAGHEPKWCDIGEM